MQFLVLGVDGPGFGSDDDLNEAHWSYMDNWADTLVARGPTRSVAGGHHTGSVHVVELPDAAAAARFAYEEPYARAGWYSTIEVTPLVPCMDGTMWDRPAQQPRGVSALVRTSFELTSVTARDLASSVRRHLDHSGSWCWIFLGITRDDDGNAAGLMGMADASPAAARKRVLELLRAVGLTDPVIETQPWRRGGRPS